MHILPFQKKPTGHNVNMLELLSLYQRARALLTLVYLDWARAATFQPAPTPASRKKNRKLLKLYISAKTSEGGMLERQK